MKTGSEQIPGGPTPVSAVVVTYQPDESLLGNLQKLSSQVAEIIVVDNGSEGESARCIDSAKAIPGVCLIRNGANLGIAAALNIGIHRALKLGRSWIATFDQDSAVPEQYFEKLFQAYHLCPAADETAMIVPGGWGASRPAGEKMSGAPTGSFVSGAVTSGSLIKAGVFLKTGFFDESLFIDYVDTDFCLRMRKSGLKILSVSSVFLQHELGEKQTLPWLRLSFRVHAAWRYYYIVRNRLVLYRRYWMSSPLWFLRDSCWLVLESGRIACLENGRGPKLRAVLTGIKDGLRGKTGRHPDFPPGRS